MFEAGFQLHAGSWSCVVLVLLGGLLGDQASYFIGRHVSHSVQRRINRWQP